MITAKILADSKNPSGVRLTSFLLTYPRFIHAELLTHRAFSRNSASSRAIPFSKMVDAVRGETALPEYWGAEQRGMQSGGEIRDTGSARVNWLSAGLDAIHAAEALAGLGVHKSLANRLIEPFAHMTVLVTATDAGLANFFALRAHPMAQPEFQVLAYRMLDIYMKSEPQEIPWGGWHIPQFGNESIQVLLNGMGERDRIKIATARCARLSYLTFDGDISPEKDIELHDRLIGPPFHASPFEHCARAVLFTPTYKWSNFDTGGVPCCWEQYRKQFENENVAVIDPAAIMSTKPDWITL